MFFIVYRLFVFFNLAYVLIFVCSSSVFTFITCLSVVCQLLINERVYVCCSCTVCSSTFTQAGSLRHHMTIHSGERRHVCPLCCRRFRAADKLRAHCLAVHSGQRPHTCDKCGRSFADRSAFRRHMRTHLSQHDNV